MIRVKLREDIYRVKTGLSYEANNPVDHFEGEYEYTPSQETQTVLIEGKQATSNIIINPIPSNYGLITWNGSTLIVS